MNSSPELSRFAIQLLRQEEPLTSADYQEYRLKLEHALTQAQRWEKWSGRVFSICFTVGLALMFVGGSKVFGPFDPWEKDATILSVSLGVIYVLALAGSWFSLASYFSRFRPNVRDIKEQLREASILALQSEISELRKQIAQILRHNDSG